MCESEFVEISARVGIPWVRASYGRAGIELMRERPVPMFSLTDFNFEEFERYLSDVRNRGRKHE